MQLAATGLSCRLQSIRPASLAATEPQIVRWAILWHSDMKKTFAIFLFFLSISTDASSDIITLRDMGNTIIPLSEAYISMESETVRVVPWMGGDRAFCKFEMRSHADSTIECLVGFPINKPPWYPEFNVKVDGAEKLVGRGMPGFDGDNPMEHNLYFEADKDGLLYPGYYRWHVTWGPRETKVIELEYVAGIPGYIEGIVRGRRFSYIVRTGKYWEGPIGKAQISFRCNWNYSSLLEQIGVDEIFARTTYPEALSKKAMDRDTLMIWEFEDWEPDQDIIYEVYAWAGEEGLYDTFVLPRAYLGDSLLYGEDYIDRLTELEFQKAEGYFPVRADTTDRTPYKYAIADILRHEILARNGYTFEAHYAGIKGWSEYFLRYRKLGWYDWQSAIPRSEAISRFSELERENYDFLGEYMKRIKAT